MAETKRKQYKWPAPLDVVFDVAIDYPAKHPEVLSTMDDVEKAVVLKDEDQGGKRYIKYEFYSDAKIPGPVQKIIKPHMLNWIQEQWWDPKTNELKVKVTPNFMANVIKVTSGFRLESTGDATTTQHFEITVKCGIPLLGVIVEKTIVDKVIASTEKQLRIDMKKAEEQAKTKG